MNPRQPFQALIIGSGAGGAMTAQVLASAGMEVMVLEEGRRWALSEYGNNCPEGMRKMYRRRGMTPIMGTVPIGYAEGRCFGGGTEINSGFWHRTPPRSCCAGKPSMISMLHMRKIWNRILTGWKNS